MLIPRFPISLTVNIDFVAVRLGPRDGFTLGTAFEQQISSHLLLDRVMD